MIGHAAHRNRFAFVKTALGQRNVQRFGRSDGVVKKHLVEIAHPVKQQRAGVLRLDLQILRHHRRYSLVAHPTPQGLCRGQQSILAAKREPPLARHLTGNRRVPC